MECNWTLTCMMVKSLGSFAQPPRDLSFITVSNAGVNQNVHQLSM